MNRLLLNNKVVWITGATSGIGKALAERLSEAGAKLILSARNLQALEALAAKLPNAVSFPLDLADPSSLENAASKAIEIFGKIDILISNAGISQRSKATETEYAVYRDIMEVNYFGTIALTQQLLPYFIQKNSGHIVALSSVAGITGLPYRTAYCAAKHAVEGYFASLRTEIWRTNIKILIVRPGAVKTNIARNALTGDGKAFNAADKIIDNGLDPNYVADRIINAIVKEDKELMIGSFKEKTLFVVNRLFPSIVFHAVKKIVH